MRLRITLDGRYIDRALKYEVLPDNEIQVYPMASNEVMTGIGKFECIGMESG
jgi:hypothetical protein